MNIYSLDVTYAYAQLGLDAGAAQEEIEAVRTNAIAYRFSTRARVRQVERLVKFFAARGKLGTPENSFDEIRKAYHRQALAFHPDRHRGNKRAEEDLKIINATYAIVDAIHREARDYFRQSETARGQIEEEARHATEREAPARANAHREVPDADMVHPASAARKARHAETAAQVGRKYMAASIPRFMRTARLSHLRLDCVIGCWFVKRDNDINLVYDVVMLPVREFMRVRAHLGTPVVMNPALQPGGLTPSYVPQDIKEVTVPAGDADPETFAKEYFRQEFGKEHKILT